MAVMNEASAKELLLGNQPTVEQRQDLVRTDANTLHRKWPTIRHANLDDLVAYLKKYGDTSNDPSPGASVFVADPKTEGEVHAGTWANARVLVLPDPETQQATLHQVLRLWVDGPTVETESMKSELFGQKQVQFQGFRTPADDVSSAQGLTVQATNTLDEEGFYAGDVRYLYSYPASIYTEFAARYGTGWLEVFRNQDELPGAVGNLPAGGNNNLFLQITNDYTYDGSAMYVPARTGGDVFAGEEMDFYFYERMNRGNTVVDFLWYGHSDYKATRAQVESFVTGKHKVRHHYDNGVNLWYAFCADPVYPALVPPP